MRHLESPADVRSLPQHADASFSVCKVVSIALCSVWQGHACRESRARAHACTVIQARPGSGVKFISRDPTATFETTGKRVTERLGDHDVDFQWLPTLQAAVSAFFVHRGCSRCSCFFVSDCNTHTGVALRLQSNDLKSYIKKTCLVDPVIQGRCAVQLTSPGSCAPSLCPPTLESHSRRSTTQP